ncbi:MAG: zf-HC2 domain-containing protein, partial [Lachnospiraceae bacterium]|nr:zf-HC2 domain-containing protein [Lachnospiraceae bacterium]
MDCARAGQLINAFIREELDHKETPAFLEHIRSCPKCYDDLEM